MQIAVIGATMYGMEQAVALAQQGHQVLLTTSGSYPGEDLIGTFRAYSDPKAVAQIEAFTGETGFATPAALKAALLRRLEKAGVQCAFYTRAVAPLLGNGAVCALLMACPNGLETYRCSLVLDATALQAPSFQVAGKPIRIKKGTPLPVRTVLQADVLPAHAIEGQRTDLFDPQRLHVVRTALLPEDMTPTQTLDYLMGLRRTMLQTLLQHPGIDQIRCDSALPLFLETALTAPDPKLKGWLRKDDPLRLPEQENAAEADTVVLNGKSLPYDPQKGLEIFHAQSLGCAEHDVLVCGGGTAGIWAALSAADRGAHPLVIERQPALGGTRTQGGVVGMYCGNRNGLFQDMWMQIRRFAEKLPGGGNPNPVTEMLFLSQAAQSRGVQVRLSSQIFCCFVEHKRIVSVLSVGDDGLFADRGLQTIDGTGEGLLCALAGCDGPVGDPQLEMTQNFSQWRRCTAARKAYSHHDQDIFLPTDNTEWTRCTKHILLSTREYDLFAMLTPRESRRIRGRKTVTLRTVARGQRWQDTLYDAYSTFDPHGRSFCTEGRLGALPALGKARFAAVPLGALLPEQLDGVIVTGKALSASQEGSNYLRMNPDVMTIGWIAGRLAADCVELGCDCPQLDLKPLQALLLEKQAMIAPARDYQAVTASTLLARILAGDEPGIFNEVVLARPEGLGELLRQAAQNRSYSNLVLLDMCRMLYHDTEGQARLTELLQQLDRENGALIYRDRQRATGVIRGGVHDVADDYWQMNRLMVLLCEEQCRDAIPVIASVLAHTLPGDTWENNSSIYSAARLDSNTIPNYDRILCLCHGISAMPDPVYLPEIERLFRDVVAVTPPKQQIWRDYLVLRIVQAAAACGGDASKLLAQARLDTDYAIVRNAVAQLTAGS